MLYCYITGTPSKGGPLERGPEDRGGPGRSVGTTVTFCGLITDTSL